MKKGDIVAVEASPGHDIGTVTLTGRLVPLQMRKANIKPDAEIKRIYRKAKPVDMEKYEEAKAKEHDTMIRSRQIAKNLNLDMKIGDVEYQGDGNKAIFYYIADERVDFRQLIKVLAEAFRVRIEMKQIGARQEAGRIGGIGPCGRELCCATWMTNFVSVSTSAARYQDISLNPQKLAGQCAKLKCCLNYEVDAYVESQKRLPSKEMTLETTDSTFYFFKADILKGTIMYSTDKNFIANAVTITARRAFEIINMNRRGEKPESLTESVKKNEPQKPVDLVEQESLTRFDKRKGNNSEITDELYNFIGQIKRETGHDKINVVAISLGGTIANSLFDRYPELYPSLDRVVYIVPALDGSNIVGDIYLGRLSTSDEMLYKNLLPNLVGGAEGYLLNAVIRMMPKQILLDTLDATVDGLTNVILRNCTTMWSLVPEAYYDEAVARVLPGEENAEMRRQVEVYHHAQVNRFANIEKMRAAGAEVFDIVDYDYQLYCLHPN